MRNFLQPLVHVRGLPHSSRFCSRYFTSSLIFCTVGRFGPLLGQYFLISMFRSDSQDMPITDENPCHTNGRQVLGRALVRFCNSSRSDCMQSSRWVVLPLLAYALLDRRPEREFSAWCPRLHTCFCSLSHAAYSVVSQKLELPVEMDVIPILI